MKSSNHKLVQENLTRRFALYADCQPSIGSSKDWAEGRRRRIAAKVVGEYGNIRHIAKSAEQRDEELRKVRKQAKEQEKEEDRPSEVSAVVADIAGREEEAFQRKEAENSTALVVGSAKKRTNDHLLQFGAGQYMEQETLAVRSKRRAPEPIKPKWHAPWKLMRVIAGHTGWVRCIAVDPSNKFFFTGSNDRTIRCFDLASGKLKLTLTSHSHAVRGLAVSNRYPYLFSVGDDKTIKCWDLETNRVIRDYHGHLQSVHCVDLHPTLDILVTGGRDACARVWDIRSRQEVHLLGGHDDSVEDLIVQGTDPQIITGSMDKTIKLWDLAAGKCLTTLTNHKKGVRALVKHPREQSFVSGAADCIKKWEARDGRLMLNLFPPGGNDSGVILNTMAVNQKDVLFSGGDDGSMRFWDYQSGHCFSESRTIAQPGSLDSETCILASSFDMTGSRLITCEADKSIKVWREDPDATEHTHPLNWDREKAIENMMNERF